MWLAAVLRSPAHGAVLVWAWGCGLVKPWGCWVGVDMGLVPRQVERVWGFPQKHGWWTNQGRGRCMGGRLTGGITSEGLARG